jgi:hypothetical protein
MKYKTWKDEVFCPKCGANMALGIDKDIVEPVVGQEYVMRTLFLYCPNQNCPLQNKRQELPEV